MVDKTSSASPTDNNDEVKTPADTSTPSGDTTPASPAGQDAAPAEGVKDDKVPEKTGLDIVREVLAKEAEPAKSSDAEPEAKPAEAAKPDAKTDDKSDDAQDDEDKALPFHKHPRFVKLVSERREYKAKTVELEQAIAAEKPLRDFATGVVGYMQKHGLDGTNVSELLEIGALIRSDPEAGLKRVEAVRTALLELLGETLPADLQKRVDDGDLSLEDAKAISKAKADKDRADARAEEAETTAKTVQETEADKARRTSIETAVNTRYAALKKDPDFAAKEKLLNAEIQHRIAAREGKPFANASAAVAMLEDAYKYVGDVLAAAAPKPTDIKPAPKGGAPQSAAPLPATASTLDVTKRALGII